MRIPAFVASLVIVLSATPARATNPPLPPLEGDDAPMLATMSMAEHLTGQVKRIYPTSDGQVYFRLVGACKVVTYFHFSTASQAGKNWYAMLMTAASSARPVRISLPQSCNDVEHQAVQYVYQDP